MIFFDFDGTLVDVWERYYRIFVAAGGLSAVEHDAYIHSKRELVKDDLVADRLHCTLAPAYYTEKKRLLERADFLKLDTLLIGVDELLEFFARYPSRILTVRRNPAAFYEQLENLGLSSIAEKSIVLHPEHRIGKVDYITAHYGTEKNVIVGDAASEYEASALANTQVVLVRTGLRDPEDFPVRRNVHIAEDVVQFVSQYKNEPYL